MKKLWKVLIALVLTLQGVLSVLPVSAAQEPVYQNIFNKNDLDNWMKALSHNGEKLVNESNYANMFTTHKIDVQEGDVITWGSFGKDEYVMELYDEDDNFIRKVYSAELEIEEEETTVIGVGGKSYTEVKASYEVSDANCAYARILGNISTIDSFMVFINLPGGLASWPDTYVPYEGNEDPDNPLYQRSALFVGDSIVNAVKDPDHPYYGWAGRIGTANDMDWKNAGISSATISTALESSYPENRVVNQLRENAGTDYDYVILQGGMNDSYAEREIGEISEGYDPAGFDLDTFSGAMEELLYTAATLYEGAKIGFIVTYATPNSNWGGLTADNAAYFRRAKEICEKWEVPYVDLYEGGVEEDGEWKSYSYDILKVDSGENMYASDPHEIHIGSKGYDVISPYIAEWMKTLQPYAGVDGMTVLIDDTDTAFVYSSGDANHGGWDSSSGSDPAVSEHWSNTPGATVKIRFNGTALKLYGKKAPNHVMFTVCIDEGEVVIGDAYHETKTDNNTLLYSSEEAGIELAAGDHTAVLTVLDQSNEHAVDAIGMNIAYAYVYGTQPDDPDETAKELRELLDTLQGTSVTVPMGADEQMIIDAVKAEVDEQLAHAGIPAGVSAAETDGFAITLTKAGTSETRVMDFDIQEKDTLTVATYNIYGWGYPDMGMINDKLTQADADIAGLQECNHEANGGGQDEQLVAEGTYPYSAFKEGYGDDTIWGGSTIVSKYPLSEQGGANYTVNDDTNRSYVRATIHVGDKEVAVYNTHIVWLEDPDLYAEYKAAQIRELIEAVENDDTPYKIITGDFNTDQSKTELDELLLHFNGANGWNNVWHETGELDESMKIGSIDHIFVTTNIEIVSVDTAEGSPSDHDLLYAQLRLKDEADLSLPRQLFDNALDDARQLAERSDIYEEESLAALNETIDAMEGLELTADNIYPVVRTLRESMAALDKKPAAIAPPVLYYDFEDGSLADRRGGYDGEAVNDPGFESGFMGEGLTLGEGYVRIDDAMQVGMEDFSVSFWMRSDEKKNDTVFFANKSGDSGNDLGVFFCNYDGFFANAGDGSSRYDTSSYDRDQTAMNGKWHLITVSADRDGALSLYVDGRLSAENRQFADLEGVSLDTGEAFVIGAGTTGGFRQDAVIDEFKMYDEALDSDQAEALYDQYMDQVKVAKTMLEHVISDAEQLMASARFDTLAPVVQTLIRNAAQQAERIYADTQVSVNECLDAWKTLADALQYAEFAADKTQLQALVDQVNAMDLSGYTEESRTALLQALAAAQEVLDDELALQERIDSAYDALRQAVDALQIQEQPDRSVLEYLIAQAEEALAEADAYDQEDDSWTAFMNAYEAACAMRDDPEATAAEIEQTALALADAYADLRLLPDEEQLAQLHDFLDQVDQLDRTRYDEAVLSQIDKTAAQARAMIEAGFDEEAFAAFLPQMEHALELMAQTKPEEGGEDLPIGQDDPDPADPADTGASGGMNGMIGMLAAAAAVTLIIRRKQS